MQLLDRYLEAMKFWLPESEQEDILNELAENIRAQAEDKEAELGRPLTLDEESALLKKHGHPMLFGVRYGRGLKYLIGPVTYPFYKLILKIGLVILALGHFINAVVLAVGKHPPGQVITSFFGFFDAAFPMLGWMTIVFAIIDRVVDKYKLLDRWAADWDPKTLPKMKRQTAKPESFWQRLLGVCAETALSLWWLVGLQRPYFIIGPAAAIVTFGPIWLKLYPAFVVLAVASIAFKWVTLLRARTALIRWVHLGFKGASLAIMLVLLRAGNLVVVAPGNTQPNAAEVVTVVQTALQLGLTIALAIGVIQLGWDAFKLLSGKSGTTAGATTCA